MDENKLAVKNGDTYLGSIERNYWGTEFTLYDFGISEE